MEINMETFLAELVKMQYKNEVVTYNQILKLAKAHGIRT